MLPRSRFWLAAFSIMALTCGLTVGSLLGDARAQDEQIELRVWDQYTESSVSPTVDAVYDAFMEANPNITIVREAVDAETMQQTVSTAMASGTGPDIINYDTGPATGGLLVEAGLILPLDEYDAQYGWSERFAPSAIEHTTIDGTLYGLPFTTDLIGMFYNQALLDQEGLTVPTTLDEMLAFCATATERGYIPIAFGNNPGWEAFHQFSMTSNQMLGPEAMRALLYENEGSWDSPEIVTAIEAFFVTMRDAGCFSEDANAISYDDGNTLFFSGQSLLHTTGSWMVGDILEAMPDAEIGFVPFPQIEEGKDRIWITGVGGAWLVSATTEHPDAAAAFIDFLYSPESLSTLIEGNRFIIPVVNVDLTGIELDSLTTLIYESRAAEGAQFGYNVDVIAPPEFNETMQSGFQAVLAGDRTAEEQAAALQAAWEEGMGAAEATPSE
jgi:raffinose/stachyose/melibiose transport system substrate-binding protein